MPLTLSATTEDDDDDSPDGDAPAPVPLLVVDESTASWIRENIPVEKAVPSLDRAYPGPFLTARSLSSPSRPRAPRYVEVNTLTWPLGADRFALGFFLADGNGADSIRDLANGEDGSTSTPLTLTMSAEGQPSGEVLAVDMTLLKIVPLSQLTTDDVDAPNNAYLLTLVDSRYHWQTLPAPDLAIPAYGSGSGSPSWLTCINLVASTLGIEIATDAIPAAYLSPDPSLNVAGASCGMLLQALVNNTGMKFVASLDGTYAIMNTTTANATRSQDQGDNPLRSTRGGGDWFQDDL